MLTFLTPTFLMVVGLATVTVFALGYALFYKSIEVQKKADKRMRSMHVDRKTKVAVQSKKVDEKQRRKMREETLKTVGAQRSAGKSVDNPPLNVRISQAGMKMSVKKFYIVSIGFGVFVAFALLVFAKAPLYIAAGAGFAAGLGLPRWVVNWKRAKRFRAFILIFPNAIDVIVRGIRSGLPLNDCLRIISQDSDEPLRGEFRKMLEATQMGISRARGVRAALQVRADLGDQLLLHRHRHPVHRRRQSVGGALGPVQGAARAARHVRQDQGRLGRGEDVGHDHRRAADHRGDPDPHHLAGLHEPACSRRRAGRRRSPAARSPWGSASSS